MTFAAPTAIAAIGSTGGRARSKMNPWQWQWTAVGALTGWLVAICVGYAVGGNRWAIWWILAFIIGGFLGYRLGAARHRPAFSTTTPLTTMRDLAEVRDRLPHLYALQRDVGRDPDAALVQALDALLPLDKLGEVQAMLDGKLDESLSSTFPFDGRDLHARLISEGEEAWTAGHER